MSSSEASNALISPSVCVCGLPLDMLSVQVQATTGNVYYLRVAHSDTIDYIRRIIAKKTKLSKERILLLYKDRQLRDGSLEEHNVRDGSKLHLVPSVETGLLSQRPEQSVMQALESLNDGQVTDFLSGKAPLNLTMRLGDHMMLIQLQLSTVSPVQHHSSSSNNSSSSSSSSSRGGSSHHFTTLRRGYSSSSSHSSSASSCTSVQTQHNNSSQLQQQNHQASPQKSILSTPPTSTSSTSAQSSRHSASRHHQHHHHHHHHHHHRNASSNGTSGGAARHHHHHHGHHYHHSHPYYHNPYPQYQLLPQPHSANSAVLQSKSTTQSQPINLQQQQLQQQQHHQKTSPPAHQNPSAISSSKNSNVLVTSSCNSSTVSSHPIYSTPPRRSSSANNYSSSNFSSPTSSLSSLSPSSPTTPWSPASFTPPPTSSLHSSNYYSNNSSNTAYTPTSSSFTNQHPQHHMTGKSSNSTTSELPIRVCPHTSVDDLDLSDLGLRSSSMGEDLSFSTRRPMAPSSVGGRVRGVSAVGLDTRALAEASRNLTQTLRQLSSEVLTNKPSAGGHQGGSVAAPHKKQTSSCNYSASQRNNGASNTAPVHDVEPSKLVSSIAAESNNLSMASESSSLKALKSSRSGRTASSVRPNATNSDKPPGRSTTHEVSGAAVSGAGIAGGESPAAAHSFGDVKRGNACSPPHQPQGAIIESMQHHGKGVFSGTFSGTLNPALQDRQGRPKRDISTIIHILNDLLCATPHYTNTAAAVAAVAAATSSKSSAPASAASASPPRSLTGEPKESVSAEDAATRSRVQHIQAMLEQRAERRRARRLARTAGSGQPYSLPGANLPKSKHQQSSSKPETQPTKNSTLKCPSGEASFVSGKKPLSEMASVLYTKGIESKIDVSANSDVVSNADTSLSSKQQQQQHHQHQHLMRELLKGCVAASTDSSSARQLNSSGSPQNFPDCESECKQQLENNYSGAAHLQQQQIHHSGDVATLAVPTEPPTAMEVADVQVESQTAESSSMDVDTTIESTTEIDSNQAPADEEHVPLKLPQDQQQQQDSVQQRSQQPPQDQQPPQPQQQKQQSSQQQEASGDAEQQDTAKIVSLNSGTVMA